MQPRRCPFTPRSRRKSDTVAKAAGAGVKHFLPKPYTAETLLKALHAVLQG